MSGALGVAYLTACSVAPIPGSRDKSSKDGVEKSYAFNNADSDGRPVVYATSTSIDNIDLTRLHPMSANFYGVQPTDVKIMNDSNNYPILLGFTNMQESTEVTDFINIVKRTCQTEGLGTIKSCLDTIIKQSGAVVFEPKVRLTQDSDPNNENLIRDVAFNTLGVKVVDVATPTGSKKALMAACVSCHNSTRTLTNSFGQKAVHINLAGDSAIADTLVTGEFDRYRTIVSNIINNPADALFQTSAKAKAAGLLAAQYEKLRSIHGPQMYATDADLKRYSTQISSNRAVASGWVFAMLAFSTSARQSCEWGSPVPSGYQSGLGDCGTGEITPALTAKRTERVSLQEFLPNGSRYNITQELLLTGAPDTIPAREMRSQLPSSAYGTEIRQAAGAGTSVGCPDDHRGR